MMALWTAIAAYNLADPDGWLDIFVGVVAGLLAVYMLAMAVAQRRARQHH